MFITCVIAVLTPFKLSKDTRTLLYIILFLTLVLLIGFRHEVGGDWFNYTTKFTIQSGDALIDSFQRDVSYDFIFWLSSQYFNGIYTTNLILSILFVGGLLKFCRSLPMPTLALSVAMPYLVIVVGMGFTRQSASLGIVMWAMSELRENKKLKYYLLIILAATFHKSAVIMIPFGLLIDWNKVNLKSLLAVLVIFGSAFYLLVFDRAFTLYHHYVERGMEADGALIKLSLTILASYFIWRNYHKWKLFHDHRYWMGISIASVMLLTLIPIAPALADRVAIYFLPLQVIVAGRLPLLIDGIANRTYFVLATLILYTSVLFVWLNYAGHVYHWVPYANYLLQ
jgi:hypothetical protein